MKPKSKRYSQRLLLAVEIPRFAREHLLKARKTWRKRLEGDFRWIPPLNLHMTLRFLGEIEVAQSKQLSKSLATLAGATAPFQISVDKVMAYPTPREAKVLGLGFQESGPLLDLVSELNASCKQMGLSKDRKPFQAQVTLARANEPSAVPELKVSPDFKGFKVKSFSLIESRMGQNGPTFHQLRQFDLLA